jgi:hypothetical protein
MSSLEERSLHRLQKMLEVQKMELGALNAQDRGVTPTVGYGETNAIALQRALEEMQGVEGGTIFIPTGVYELAGAINMEVSTVASAVGTVRITVEGGPTVVQRDENNLFVVTDAYDEVAVGHAVFEGLRFQRSPEAARP